KRATAHTNPSADTNTHANFNAGAYTSTDASTNADTSTSACTRRSRLRVGRDPLEKRRGDQDACGLPRSPGALSQLRICHLGGGTHRGIEEIASERSWTGVMRKSIASFSIALLLALGLAARASAQTFPSKPVTIVVALPAGGAVDSLARVLAE